MDVEIPVLAGYLNVPTQTGFSLNRISKKKSCSRYCLLFKASRHGIARLEICENKDDKNPKIFTLENCVKITQEPPPANLIQIVKRNGQLTLNTNSDEELKDWVTALQMVAFCDISGMHAAHGAIEEDNDLYCSSFDGLFIITLIPSEASIRCNIEPRTYMLQMTPTELQLKSEDLNVTIAMWPYRFIRKYGYRDGKFTFEAGRKCTTGEGVFTLDHTNPQELFRCMSAKMKSMKKLISGDSLSSIECNENQFSAAAGMEPGSRSPLPPSPSSNPHGGEFEINSTQSCISLRGFISSNDSLNNFSSNGSINVSLSVPSTQSSQSQSQLQSQSQTQSQLKHIPNKPPRKLPSPLDKLTTTTGTAIGTVAGGASAAAAAAAAAALQTQCDNNKYKNLVKYEPVAITTSSASDANSKNSGGGSAVILKPSSPAPELLLHHHHPPDLPLRNESCGGGKLLTVERDYECIENITDAWKTRGVGDVRHCERIPSATLSCDTDFVRQRSQAKRKDASNGGNSGTSTPKIIDIDIGEGLGAGCAGGGGGGVLVSPDANYDRLDFLSPNNKTSSGYKTIVNLNLPANRLLRCSPPPPNEYELIASPDTESFRKADDSHLGYGVLRKANNNTANSSNNNNNNNSSNTNNNNLSNNNNNIALPANNISADICLARGVATPPSTPLTATTPTSTSTGIATTTNNKNEAALDHRSYNGLNYTIVSKPKRV
ncbi:probable serine/threonine-protein kinase ndrD [Drosophila sulfurigaster albostrigata]|uniref:probable serine/threonine-protein kinase ndrD n=1 Tax=Drosophila sulfurigaster albostrigata TaxID=89887 RepID=UPI002D21C5FC|nr:probable serine/threonine-protein kinase ndrD [Drosophila sulfurigaster albostrigata]